VEKEKINTKGSKIPLDESNDDYDKNVNSNKYGDDDVGCDE
jgi:hypothetical protein